MALTKFAIAPNQSGYAVKDGKETLSVKLGGGASRYRRDVQNAASIVSVQWTMNKGEYRYFRAFYNSVTISGSTPFLIDLMEKLHTKNPTIQIRTYQYATLEYRAQ